jgi:hypothetical protein
MGTLWQEAWGTAGTQYMKPSPHIEGLGSYAAKLDDRICFLACQQADTVFSEDINKQYVLSLDTFAMLDRYKVYYNGHHPQLMFGFEHRWNGEPGNEASATYSLRLGDVDFGTIMVEETFLGGSVVEWYADIPDSFAAGEYMFRFDGASGDAGYPDIDAAAGAHLTFLPTRFF